MRLGYTTTEERAALDPLLHRVAMSSMAAGLRVAGVVQINTETPNAARCDMDVIVLPEGPVIRISQSLGPAARGCRLDPAGLETAVGKTQGQLAQQPDILFINKFGKQEAAGRGFRPLIATALEQGTDVLVGVNALNLDALNVFSGGLAESVAPDEDALLSWVTERNTAR